MKFKVGDRVRLLEGASDGWREMRFYNKALVPGAVVTVVDTRYKESVQVEADEDSRRWWILGQYLEVIEAVATHLIVPNDNDPWGSWILGWEGHRIVSHIPAPEPEKPEWAEWADAQVVQARAGIRAYPEYLTHLHSSRLFRSPDGDGSLFMADELRDVTVIIDNKDGRNVEAERQRERAEHNANAVNDNADMIVELRGELVELRVELHRARQALREIRTTVRSAL